MNRAVRFACLFALASVAPAAAAGCGTATTLEEDAGIILGTDTGGGAIDTGRSTVDTGTITPVDTGTMPPVDTGPFTRPDLGGFTRPDMGPPMPGNDAGTTMGIMCGTSVCADTQVCCVNRDPGGMMLTMMCSDPAGCMGIPVACDGPEDCMTGEVCCASGGAGGGGSAMCAAEADCGGFTSIRLCHTDTDCSGTDACCSFMGISGCIPPGFCP